MSVLGLDVGTSACKGLVVDADGRLLAATRRSYRFDLPAPGRVELPAGRVWSAVRHVIVRSATAAVEAGSPLRAMAVSGSGDEVCAVDERGRAVGPVIVAIDTRSTREARRLARHFGAQVLFERTGLSQLGMTPLARLLWMRTGAPSDAGRVVQLLAWPELVSLRLGLEPRAEPTLAGRSLAWDLRTGAWAADILADLGMAADLFPPVVPTGSVVGEVADPPAARLGLGRGVLLVAGGFDQALATLGAGALDEGTAHVGAGSWEALSAVLPRPLTAPLLRRGGWSVGRSAGGSGGFLAMASYLGGSALRWGASLAAPGRPEGPPPGLARLVREAPAGPARLLFLPHLEGATSPVPDPAARGALVGLDLASGRGEIMAAIMEALAVQLRLTAEQLGAAGARLERLRVTGGGARSRRWLQLRADATGLPVERPVVTESGAFGAALLAGAAVGCWDDAAEAARSLVRVAVRVEPRPGLAGHYAERAQLQRELQAALTTWRATSRP